MVGYRSEADQILEHAEDKYGTAGSFSWVAHIRRLEAEATTEEAKKL